MGRRQFNEDLKAEAEGTTVPRIVRVVIGEDGEEFHFHYQTVSGYVAIITVLPTDPAAYPSNGNSYFVSTEKNEYIMSWADTLECMCIEGKTIRGLIGSLSEHIRWIDHGCVDEGSPIPLDHDPGALSTYEDEDDDRHPDIEDSWFPDTDSEFEGDDGNGSRMLNPRVAKELGERIVSDLKCLRMAGYRVGVHHGMKANSKSSLLSVSLRINKLELSDEVLQAWNLERDQYIVLLIKYDGGYEPLEKVIEHENNRNITFRLGVNYRYKPTFDEAIAAFSSAKKPNTETSGRDEQKDGPPRRRSQSPVKGYRSNSRLRSREKKMCPESHPGFRLCFISAPMRQLMDDLFIKVLKIRIQHQCSWENAKSQYESQRSLPATAQGHEFITIEETPTKKSLPEIVTRDDIVDSSPGKQLSFPVVAMQFAILYLMRCTEFCLVCHKRIDDSFEALKPYVCSSPLCLYQYMSLGFGPSIEHEILSQPYVVDLLISLCYAAAGSNFGTSMRGFPDGMGLTVPPPPPHAWPSMFATQRMPMGVVQQNEYRSDPSVAYTTATAWEESRHGVNTDFGKKILTLQSTEKEIPHLRSGDWLMLTYPDSSNNENKRTVHVRVECYIHPKIFLVEVPEEATWYAKTIGNCVAAGSLLETRIATDPLNAVNAAEISPYKLHFDELSGPVKAAVIIELLNTLPSVKDMAAYLSQDGASEAQLHKWADRMSSPALLLLRWIVASNRSCIIQVDMCPGQSEGEDPAKGVRLQQRLTGLTEFAQFRFAQGDPDKEQRFHQAMDLKMQNKPRYHCPSIFAWHGSPLANWHSIIRYGLDFRDTINGRAYGNGVYHDKDFAISHGYSHAGRINMMNNGNKYTSWPSSALQVSGCIALNEIVNAPEEFVSSNPYLVVQYPDWIQSRYLVVQCTGQAEAIADQNAVFRNTGLKKASNDPLAQPSAKEEPYGLFLVQDPNIQCMRLEKVVDIPIGAFPRSRGFATRSEGSTTLPPPSGDIPHPELVPKAKKRSPPKTSSLAKKRKSESPALAPWKDGNHHFESDVSDLEDVAFMHSTSDYEGSSAPSAKDKGKGKGPPDSQTSIDSEDGKPLTDFVPGSLDRSTIVQLASPTYATSTASKRLSQDLRALLKVQKSTPLHELGCYIDPTANLDNLYQWIVELHSFPEELPLATDMKAAGVTSIVLEIRYGASYPMEPPFVRVIRPRFLPFMQGGGGHVTAGGALCMELLTNSGWSAVSTIESVLLQVRMAIMSADPKPARLIHMGQELTGPLKGWGDTDYGVVEAVDAYERACKMHGWKFPDMRGVGGSALMSQPPLNDK